MSQANWPRSRFTVDAALALTKREAELKRLGVALSLQAKIAFVDGYQIARHDVARFIRKSQSHRRKHGRTK